MVAPAGDIKDMTVPWLFQDLRIENKSGTIVFARDNAVKKVYIKAGEIIYASSNVAAEQFADCLLRTGKITKEHYDIAADVVQQTGKQIGGVLVERGFISPQDLVAGAKLQVKEIILSLFTWRDGRYIFDNGPLPAADIVPLQMSTGDIIIEGVRELEWKGIRKSLPSLNTILKPVANPALLFQGAHLEADQKSVLELIDGRKSMQEICSASGIGDFNTLKAVFMLLALRMVEKGEVKSEQEMKFVPEKEPTAADKKTGEAAPANALASREMVIHAFESMDLQNHYEILGIGRNATQQEIKKAYFQLAKLYHPDRHFDPGMSDLMEKLQFLFSRIHEAYDTLSTPEKRDQYNVDLLGGAKSKAAAARSAKADEKHSSMTQFNEGMKHFNAGNYWGADEAFQWAIRLDPENAEFYFRRALTLARVPRRGHQAEENFTRAIKLAPKKIEYYLELGNFYARSGMKKRALAVYEDALAKDPTSDKVKQAILRVNK